jgi:hypothetical protein
MAGWDAFCSCEASWSGCQSDHSDSQLVSQDSLNRSEHCYLHTSPTQGETLVLTGCHRDGAR